MVAFDSISEPIAPDVFRPSQPRPLNTCIKQKTSSFAKRVVPYLTNNIGKGPGGEIWVF